MIARLLISPLEKRVGEIRNILASHLTSGNTNHPDLLYIKSGEKLGISEARKIKEHFSFKPYSAPGKVVVLEDASVMTIEAQNALLKTIEELPREAILILGAGSDANLLPTILSRCQIVILGTRRQPETPEPGSRTSPDGIGDTRQSRCQDSKFTKDLEELLNSSTEERFGYIEKLKNKEEFLKALLSYFHQDVKKNKGFLRELLQAEEWAKQNVNIRAILEYLMLVMPSGRC